MMPDEITNAHLNRWSQSSTRLSFDSRSGATPDSRFEKVSPTQRSDSLDIISSGQKLTIALPAAHGAVAWQATGADLFRRMELLGLSSIRLPQSEIMGGADCLGELLVGFTSAGFSPLDLRRVPASQRTVELDAEDEVVARRFMSIGETVNIVRSWVAAPPNILTPSKWITETQSLFKGSEVTIQVIDQSALLALGANALVAVGQASSDGSSLLILEYRGTPTRARWDAAWIGKGITFDAGGLNLKPRPNIAKMKLDMAGGAAVIGAIRLAALRASTANVVAIVPLAENLIDAEGFRPGDVVKTLAGLTIEVVDTDFEGRLILADALTYAARTYHPQTLIDLATLTTAVTACLHEEFAGLYASCDTLATALAMAGNAVGERNWRMPLDADQSYLTVSDVADLRNIGEAGYFGMGIGSPTAGAQFLRPFAQNIPWAHLDITGVCWTSRMSAQRSAGASGYGARLLDCWLSEREQSVDFSQ